MLIISDKKSSIDFYKWTVKELKEFCSKNNIKIPAKSRKKDIVELIQNIVSHPDFIDRSQEEMLEEEIVAEFDDEDLALLRKEKMELKFWQKPPYSSLLDPELAKESDIAFYDLASLVDKFFDNMLHEDLINYKISGIALKTSASLHHYKISSIIREEEHIQKMEELKKFRERHARSIPKALPQPIQPKMQIATKDELFDAMRSAIIEVMQNKEKIRRRQMRKDELKQQRLQIKSKAQESFDFIFNEYQELFKVMIELNFVYAGDPHFKKIINKMKETTAKQQLLNAMTKREDEMRDWGIEIGISPSQVVIASLNRLEALSKKKNSSSR